jgi:hypothetical protein
MKRALLIVCISILTAFGNISIGHGVSESTKMEVSESGNLKLSQNYPNPAKGYTFIRMSFEGTAELSVYDLLGQLIEKRVVTESTLKLDVSAYADGIYHYTLESNGEKITKRMTVRNN